MSESLFNDYRKRLTREAWLRAGLFALVLGFVALFVSTFVFWFVGFKKIWVGAIIFGGVTALAVPALYFWHYKPSDKDIAMRIDALGLDERMLTREHLKNEAGFMALKQASDAIGALVSVNPKMLSILVSIPLIIGVSVSGVASVGMTTVSVLTSKGVIKSGNEFIEELLKEEIPTFEIEYIDSEGGIVDGELFQIVEQGANASGVMAIPDDEFAFALWSDGVMTPYREDKNIKASFEVFAIFMPLMPGMESEEEGEGDEEGGKPGDKEGPSKPSDKPPEEPNPGGAGRWEPANWIIDGETFYGDTTYDAYYESMLEELAKSENISDDLKKIIEAYFDTIEQ